MGVDAEATQHLGRYLEHLAPAMAKLDDLVGESTIDVAS
jgi:hypothetical protein